MKDIDDLLTDFTAEVSNLPVASGRTLFPDSDRHTNTEIIPTQYNDQTEPAPVPRIFSTNDLINDFIQIRNDLIFVMEGTKDLLRSMPIEVCIAKASMVAAVASLHGSINANGRLLIEIHEKIQKMQRDYLLISNGQNPDQANINVTNNNMNINTKDLNSIIEELMKKEKEKEKEKENSN